MYLVPGYCDTQRAPHGDAHSIPFAASQPDGFAISYPCDSDSIPYSLSHGHSHPIADGDDYPIAYSHLHPVTHQAQSGPAAQSVTARSLRGCGSPAICPTL